MSQTTPGNLGQGLVRENWGDLYIKPMYEQARVLPFAANLSKDCKKGDLVNVPVRSTALTVGTVNATTGALNIQQVTASNVAVSVDRQKDCTIDLLDITREQAESKFENEWPEESGSAVAEEMEAAFLALQSDVTASVGSDVNDMGEDEILAAIQALKTAKLPIDTKPNEFYFALADNAWLPLRKLKIFDYQVTGVSGESAAKSLSLPSYGSIPVRFSTQVATSGAGRRSILAHRNAFAWAAQKNPEVAMTSRLAAGQASYLMTNIALYGVKTVREGFARVIKSKA